MTFRKREAETCCILSRPHPIKHPSKMRFCICDRMRWEEDSGGFSNDLAETKDGVMSESTLRVSKNIAPSETQSELILVDK